MPLMPQIYRQETTIKTKGIVLASRTKWEGEKGISRRLDGERGALITRTTLQRLRLRVRGGLPFHAVPGKGKQIT